MVKYYVVSYQFVFRNELKQVHAVEFAKKIENFEVLNFFFLKLANNCDYVRNQTLDKAIGEYFSLPGLSSITVIEQSKRKNNWYRKKENTT